MPTELAEREKKNPMVHVRLDPTTLKKVDYLSVDWTTTRGAAIQRLLDEALTKYEALKERNSLLQAVH